MKWVQKHLTIVIRIVALLVIAGALLLFESDQLWKVQEKNLFFCTTLFLREQLVVPGGLLTWIGRFFTQFLYYPWLGVSLLCAWWYLLMSLTKRTFRIPDRWTVLLLIPVVILLISNMDMGYWIYVLKLKGHFFVTTIGTTIVVALLWLFRRIPDQYCLRAVCILLTIIIGYPLLGIYGLVAALLMALWSWRLSTHRMNAIACSVAAVAGVAAVPLFCYRFVYYQTNMVNLWWTALPIFKIVEENTEYYIPYALLGVCLLLLVVVKWTKEDAKGKKLRAAVVVAVLAATVYGVWYGWMKDENFHREAAMYHYAEQCNWEDVLKEADKQQDVTTRAVALMRNLALARLGRQSTEMYRYPNGSKKPASPFAPPASMVIGDLIYYHYGMLNDSHHMCIEAGVEFGWRPEHLKYLARCGLMANEVNVMYKYTEILKHTLFHGAWAEHLETLQQNPKMMEEDKETGPVMHMLHYPDMVGADRGYAERYLMNHLATLDSDDPYFQEQCLLATLWTKDVEQFWRRFLVYLKQHPNKPIPRYYQEAAYLYSDIAGGAPVKIPYDNGVKETYKQFVELVKKYDGRDLPEVRAALYPLFGDTFFFEFYLTGDVAYL
jgi:hypothetical protein